jgi:hypothetical protein
VTVVVLATALLFGHRALAVGNALGAFGAGDQPLVSHLAGVFLVEVGRLLVEFGRPAVSRGCTRMRRRSSMSKDRCELRVSDALVLG